MLISISPIGLLLCSVLYYFLQTEELIALIIAVLIHEIGHIITLTIMGVSIEKITLNGAGLYIEYAYELSPMEELFATISGPMFGVMWYIIANELGQTLSANLSIILSAYNIIPFSILDGGRAVNSIIRLFKGEKMAKIYSAKIDRVLCIMMAILGIYCVFMGFGVAILISSCWLIIYVLVKPPTIV